MLPSAEPVVDEGRHAYSSPVDIDHDWRIRRERQASLRTAFGPRADGNDGHCHENREMSYVIPHYYIRSRSFCRRTPQPINFGRGSFGWQESTIEMGAPRLLLPPRSDPKLRHNIQPLPWPPPLLWACLP